MDYEFKSPLNSKKKLTKSLSYNNYDSSHTSKIIFKIRERIFNQKTLSLLSKNDSYIKNNRLLPILSPNFNQKKLDKSNFPHRNRYLFYKQNKLRKSQSLEDEESTKDKPKLSTFLFKNNYKFKKRKSALLMNEDIQESETRKKVFDYFSYLLINQIIKFKDNKKKGIIKKKITPMQFGKKYHDFINRRNRLNFNPNFNSAYIHRLNSSYMINKILLEKKSGFNTLNDKLNLNLDVKCVDTEENLELELRDEVKAFSPDIENYKKLVKLYLTDGIKLNIKSFHEKFFDKYENRINFLFDDRKFPTIKNKLKIMIIDIKAEGFYEWKFLNMIENSNLTYLHKLKVKIQRELDEVEKKGNKGKQFEINQQIEKYDINFRKMRKRSIINIMNENANYENIKNINDHIKHIVNVLKIDNISDDEVEKVTEYVFKDSMKEDMYNLEEFFVNKKGKYKTIDFANDKLTNIVYNSPNFYIEYFSNNVHQENYNSIKELKNLDLFL